MPPHGDAFTKYILKFVLRGRRGFVCGGLDHLHKKHMRIYIARRIVSTML